MFKAKINDLVKFKGKTPTNSVGRVIKIDDEGVWIVNMNMPFMGDHGTSNPLFVKSEEIEKF